MILDITNGGVSGVAYWKAERFLVRWATVGDEVVFYDATGGGSVEVARYTPSSDGVVLIDITDFVRAYPERNSLIFQSGTTGRNVSFVVAGRINPAGVLIPKHELLEAQSPAIIAPPQKMILDAQNSNFVMAEFYSENPNDWTVDGFAQWDNTRRNLVNFGIAGFTLTDGIIREDFRPELVNDCRPYALVEWESFTGAKRRHVFYITKQANEANDVVSLENVQNEYTEIKGETDGFSLRLEDLSRYDLWYYSDVITSSDVRVSIDGGATFYRVQVTDKKYSIPESDSGRFSELEIAIKFRKYDTI